MSDTGWLGAFPGSTDLDKLSCFHDEARRRYIFFLKTERAEGTNGIIVESS